MEDLKNMARIWRLEIGENVMHIEREFDYETRDNLPLPLEGRILQDTEVIEDIKKPPELPPVINVEYALLFTF